MKGLKELLEREKIKIEHNTHGILKYGRVDFTDEDDEITSIKDYQLCSTEEDYDASYIDYTVVKGGVVLMQCVSAGTVDNYLRHLVKENPEAFASSKLSADDTKKVKQIVKKLRKQNIMPWYVETEAEYDNFGIDDFINKEEIKLLSKCKNLHDIIKKEYIGFMDVNVYIPEEVLDAYKESKRYYSASQICIYLLNGVIVDWYDHVIFNWMKKFKNPKEAAYVLYMQNI